MGSGKHLFSVIFCNLTWKWMEILTPFISVTVTATETHKSISKIDTFFQLLINNRGGDEKSRLQLIYDESADACRFPPLNYHSHYKWTPSIKWWWMFQILATLAVSLGPFAAGLGKGYSSPALASLQGLNSIHQQHGGHHQHSSHGHSRTSLGHWAGNSSVPSAPTFRVPPSAGQSRYISFLLIFFFTFSSFSFWTKMSGNKMKKQGTCVIPFFRADAWKRLMKSLTFRLAQFYCSLYD